MLASNNILKPSDGRLVTPPTQDAIIGLHHLTTLKGGRRRRRPRVLLHRRAILAHDQHWPTNAKVRIRSSDVSLLNEGAASRAGFRKSAKPVPS
jgi:DNA-directed RNA polymerase subunit beta'